LAWLNYVTCDIGYKIQEVPLK